MQNFIYLRHVHSNGLSIYYRADAFENTFSYQSYYKGVFNPTKNYIAGGVYSFTQQIMILQLFEANLEVTKMQVEIQVANLLTAYRSMATCYHYLCYRKPNDTHRNCHHLITASRYHLKKILRNFFNLFFLLPFLIFRWNSRQSIYNGFLFYT